MVLGSWFLVLGVGVVSPQVFAKGPKPLKAVAVLQDAEGKKVGTAKFAEVPGGVRMKLTVSKLALGRHGIHIHETGTCKGPDFKSAGGHFNPAHKQHGLHNRKGAHAGDLPNLVANAKGKAKITIMMDHVVLGEGKNSLLGPGGTAVVVHEKADDEKTDPSGNSGTRIACGVIEK